MPTLKVIDKVFGKQWEVTCTLPNHGQHYCQIFNKKELAMIFANINMSNPQWDTVIVHSIIDL